MFDDRDVKALALQHAALQRRADKLLAPYLENPDRVPGTLMDWDRDRDAEAGQALGDLFTMRAERAGLLGSADERAARAARECSRLVYEWQQGR